MMFPIDQNAFNECFDKFLRELRHAEIELRAVSSERPVNLHSSDFNNFYENKRTYLSNRTNSVRMNNGSLRNDSWTRVSAVQHPIQIKQTRDQSLRFRLGPVIGLQIIETPFDLIDFALYKYNKPKCHNCRPRRSYRIHTIYATNYHWAQRNNCMRNDRVFVNNGQHVTKRLRRGGWNQKTGACRE